MKRYKVLQKQIYSENTYSLVPIRFEDRMVIMKWRNEQIYHLRQSKLLTEEDQKNYFKNVVSKLFDQEQPDQILFSLYVVKESGQFSCRGFRCLNVGFFLLKIVVFVFLGTVV